MHFLLDEHNIMEFDEEMRKYSNITYLPYASIDHLKILYRQAFVVMRTKSIHLIKSLTEDDKKYLIRIAV